MDEVIAGNGSDDILTIIFRTFLDAGDVLVTPAPSYMLYKPLSALQDATFKEIPMGPGYTLPEDLDEHGAKVVIIVNPNAPTGVASRAALRAFLERTQSIVVIDEAYADFAGESVIDMVKEFPHLIVVRTFSKAYALAGMRLGLGLARREIIAEMMKVKDSYNLDSLAIVAGCAALQDQEWLQETVGMIVRTRTWVQQELEGMGLYVPPSRSNFVFPTIPDGRVAEVFEALENAVSWCGISVDHACRTRSVSASVLMLKWRLVYRRCASRSPRGRSHRSQEGEHRVVHVPVRDHGITAIDRWCASEITKTSTRLLDKDFERCHVPGFYTRLEHDLGLATTHKRIGEIITKPTLSSRCLHQPGQTLPVAIPQHEIETAVQQGRLGQIGDGRHG